ncbi:hypothetical protein [Aquimarina sp. SS2-1]|uniref:hypothetical protein n=1 Tax=Aquimarina besae TaxID=3342247 RepID=UPI00366CE396
MNTLTSHMSEKNFWSQLQSALYEPDKQKVVQLIESDKIEINEYLDASNLNSILMNAVNCSPLFCGSKEQIGIINYLMDLKADVN